jgi:predicted aldo/keto reductase-like oxidoreductase
MQYRKFGKLDFQVSALGFGAMRLPTQEKQVNEDEAREMVYYAIDHGVNYVDTAYPYHGGQSEKFLGKILKDGYREKVKVATKLPTWLTNEKADFDKYFHEQLQRLQMEYVDFYLLHGLNAKSWAKVRDLGVIEWAEDQIKQGRVKYLGFSFHDKPPVFTEIIDAYDWTFTQVQYNYMDIDTQPGTEGVRHAASKGIAVIAMEPILGGRLVDPPEKIQALWDTAEIKRTPADWALQWLWNQPEISVVLSGMSTMQQVEENVVSADRSRTNILTQAELELISNVREQYKTFAIIPCTQCEYCMPCPSGVNIPRNFEIYNLGIMYEKQAMARDGYKNWMGEAIRANNCTQCQECEEKCPQSIPISRWMPIVHDVLGNGQEYRTIL